MDIRDEIDNLKQELADLKSFTSYEIGDVYITESDINPEEKFGGKWELTAEGRVLVGYDSTDTDFDTIGETGGAKTHTLTQAEMPTHNHNLSDTIRNNSSGPNNPGHSLGSTTSGTPPMFATNTGGGFTIWSRNVKDRGGGAAHNNLQPYQAIYIWKRVG